MAELPEGTVFAGHRIDGVAGRGGMGVVYRATHLALDHVVALKVIAPELADDPKFRERFVRESRTAVSIRHPNVVQVRHAGEESGVLFVTMDYVDGSDLRALISAERRLEPARAAWIIGEVAAALDAAHARGLVHRDVKPGNVLIERRGTDEHVFLTDFGLTKRMSGATELTASGAFIGTLEYMAPEQIRGGELDARTDVYALGGVAFAALTGEPPFGRVDGDVAKLYAHLNDPVPRASDRTPGLPAAMDRVLQRAMAKDPDERYASAGEFGRALQAAMGAAEATQPAATLREEAPEPATAETKQATPPGTARLANRWRAFAALAGLAVVAAAAVALVGSGDDPAAGGAPASVGTPIEVGEFSLGVAAKGRRVFVADRGGDKLAVVNARQLKPLDPVRAGIEPEAVFAGDPIVWVANAGGSISRFDLSDGRLLLEDAAPTINLGGRLQDVAVRDHAAWVTDSAGDTVTRIEPRAGVVSSQPIPVGDDPYGVAVDPGNPDLIFVVNRGDDTVSVIDRVDKAVLDEGFVTEPEIGVGDRPKAVVVVDGVAWVTNTDDGSVSRIEATAPFPETRIEDVCDQPRDIAAGFNAIWISCGEGAVAQIDPATNDFEQIELDIEGSPEGIAVGTDLVWVAMGDPGTVVPIAPAEE